METEELSQYELERLETIKRNNAVLVSMGLMEAVAATRQPPPTEKPKPKKQKQVQQPILRNQYVEHSKLDEAFFRNEERNADRRARKQARKIKLARKI